ncbi:hypothetical protein AM493_10105 [Flavobacterium akiainvivens]|uniref:3-oxoacyl-ACP reductase n=1 Tax=Flavobacterium akiainvivens TaxID=1202724 RepID=A0A0M8MB17_9FLAO|nr:SDR family NAD(P)-dependent oxidoreductase [Flavobacterium akiainvivens]KOS06345.1 hypothetical protein AM493_10105 [Flavobacterium akiainvivens]SFQ15686.1 meso-butanediol dehydrogenase / (S,S)-butanediol dehydrogenase / diacetyl reductase [Flavobacterium akiainvivens]
MKNRFEGKVAIVTGGASGIGKATVKIFIEEGAKVTVADMDEAGLKAMKDQYGDAVLTIKVDVSSEEDVKKMVEDTVTAFGRLDILHNNAGIGGFALIPDMKLEDWRKVFAIDADGVFLGCKYAIPVMKKQGGGSIVNTASISGLGADYAMASYNAAKAAVINLTRIVANDHGPDKIRCNAVCPGPIETPLLKAALTDDILQAYHDAIPAGRVGKPEEIATVVAFLASDESSYVNGTTIVADGGLMAKTGQPPIAKKLMS